MSALATTALGALILQHNVVWEGRATAYAPHLRHHELGEHGRAEQLAQQARIAAAVADVELALYYALVEQESNLDHGAVSDRGALGASQLMPTSRWGRRWLAETAFLAELGVDGREQLNMIWGAYALRDALDECGGNELLALGFYRSGGCVVGPRALETAARAQEVRWHLFDHAVREGA